MTGRSGDDWAMVRRKSPFTHFERFWCWLAAVVLLTGSVIGIVIALQRQHWPLGLSAIGAGAIGALYALAAKLGPPLHVWWR
jgi:hypothetical protein